MQIIFLALHKHATNCRLLHLSRALPLALCCRSCFLTPLANIVGPTLIIHALILTHYLLEQNGTQFAAVQASEGPVDKPHRHHSLPFSCCMPNGPPCFYALSHLLRGELQSWPGGEPAEEGICLEAAGMSLPRGSLTKYWPKAVDRKLRSHSCA